MEPVKVSVIIPVYNSAPFLKDAVDSLLAQDYDNKEIILVDDGSTDESGSLCDYLAVKHPCIQSFHKPNGGICSARNYGLEKASGDYLTFMDNDDICLPGFIRDNAELARQYDADCVRFGRTARTISTKDQLIAETTLTPTHFAVLRGDDIFANYDAVRSSGNGVWTGMYRRGFLEEHGLVFDESLKHGYEDALFVLNAYRYAKTVVINPNVYYVWVRRNSHSTSLKRSDENHFSGLAKALDTEVALMKNREVDALLPAFYSKRIMEWVYEGFSLGCRWHSGFTRSEAVKSLSQINSLFGPLLTPDIRENLTVVDNFLLRLLLSEHYNALFLALRSAYGIGTPKMMLMY